ncbi:MAG TPA: zf-TFIIB domain-containing protein, partial [Burkholderiaceae bacterium]
MDCPVCTNTKLLMSERQGIEIDYCPNCRGVWLDRGELDKIIDRSIAVGAEPAAAPVQAPPPQAQGFGHAPQPERYPPPQHQAPYPQDRYAQPRQGYPQQHGHYKK